ncbi:ferredoxin [Streptomyces sp. NPDC051976]|uniref:ferredoxin n=1 Tax=Streptomyces sp. NPDC051976 TaxID=3154947 RepID=UPI00343DF1DC
MATDHEPLEVWIDQDLCTGDGICAQYAPDVFALDVDGLAYLRGSGEELLYEPGATARVPAPAAADVVRSVQDCPGECIHLRGTGEAS